MLFHFSIILLNFKKKKIKFEQEQYDFFFTNIEYNLRELGFGDVSVNSKMKDLNKISYDILLKIDLEKDKSKSFKINNDLVSKYFSSLKGKSNKYIEFERYFTNFFHFCFELPLDNMIEGLKNFKN